MAYCPLCGSTTVGKVGNGQYYCWNCYFEYNNGEDGLSVYNIAEDGSLEDVTTVLPQADTEITM